MILLTQLYFLICGFHPFIFLLVMLSVPPLPDLPQSEREQLKEALNEMNESMIHIDLIEGNGNDEVINLLNIRLLHSGIPVFPYISACLQVLDLKELPLKVKLAMDVAPSHANTLLPKMNSKTDWKELTIQNRHLRISFLPVLYIFIHRYRIKLC